MYSVDSINETSSTMFKSIHFRLLQLLITLGLILSIVGGTSSISSTGVYTVQTTSEAGAVLYLVAYLALCLVTAFTVLSVSSVRYGDNRIVWAVVIAMPLILIRLIYTLLTVFHHDHLFNIVSGSVTVLVLMDVLEEILVVAIYLFIGWKTEAAPKTARGPIESRPWKGQLAGAAGPGGPQRHRQGPIHTLLQAGIEAAHGSRDGV